MAKRKVPSKPPPTPQAAASTPKVRKVYPRPRFKYPPATAATVQGLLAYHDQWVRYALEPEVAPAPDRDLLLRGLPQGYVASANLAVEHDRVVVSFKAAPMCQFKRDEGLTAHTVPLGFFVLRALSLFEGHAFDNSYRGPPDAGGIVLLAAGFTLPRLLADADAEEVVAQLNGRDDLCPWSLRVEPGRHRALRGRQEAIAHALRRYERHAAAWGLADIITVETYEALLKGAFRLFDAEHGKHFLRPLSGR